MRHIMEYSYLAKIVIIGDEAVGKSQLLNRFAFNKFDSNHKQTIGVQFAVKSISSKDNKSIKLQICDTTGNPRFLSITQTYFRGASILLLVIAETDKDKKIEQITKWLQIIDELKTQYNISQSEIPEPKIVIVENKCDVSGNIPLDENDLAQFRGRYELFVSCSARSGDCEGKLITAFQSVLATILPSNLEPSNQDRNAPAEVPLTTNLHMARRNENDTTSVNIRNLNEQQADLILKALHNLLIHGPVHAKHYKINFGKGKSIDNTKFGEPNNGEMITVPEHAH